METTFKDWLIQQKGFGKGTANSICSRINRIRDVYDIEAAYEKDACAELLEDLTYTPQDAKMGRVPGAVIPIKGSYVDGFRSLKKALEHYVDYLQATYVPKKAKGNTKPCYYQGDRRGFHGYLGPKWRNVIQLLTKMPRRTLQQCECCGARETLDAAHIGGRARITIIDDILDSDYRIGPDQFLVDLTEFEEKFKQEHLPWEKAFYFLCRKCHNQYDGNDPVQSQAIEDQIKQNRLSRKTP